MSLRLLLARIARCRVSCRPCSAVVPLVPAAASSRGSKLALTVMSVAAAGLLGFDALRARQADPVSQAPPHKQESAPESPPSSVAEKARPRLDRFGDPLPEGAIRRFGTLRFRHHGMSDLAFTP